MKGINSDISPEKIPSSLFRYMGSVRKITVFEKIDMRLALFPLYLKDMVNNWEQTPWGIMHVWIKTGVRYSYEYTYDTFDSWLIYNHHSFLLFPDEPKEEALNNKIEWRTPCPQAYDGSEINRIYLDGFGLYE